MSEKSAPPGRRILLLRHGERVDRVFPKDWVDKAYTMPFVVYKRFDINLPRVLPLRSASHEYNFDIADYNFDHPLTALAEGVAEQLGYHTSFTHWKFTAAYSSPSLRCLETVNRYLTGLKLGKAATDHLLPLKVDAGLFDFCGFNEYQFSGIPTFLDAEWMSKRGVSMSTSYKPSAVRENLSQNETIEEFYRRVDKTLKHILKENAKPSPKHGPASILLATHAPFIDAACQVLLKQPPRKDEALKDVSNYLKYVGTLALEEEGRDKWRLIPPPVRTFRYCTNEKFECKKVFKDAFGGGEEEEGD